MVHLFQSAFFEALGWSLVDSLWQTGVLWGVYNLITLNGKRLTAAQRHNLALLSLNAATLWFLVSLVFNYHHIVNDKQFYSLSYLINEGVLHDFGNIRKFDEVIPVLSLIYLVAIIIYSTILVFQFKSTQASLRSSLQQVNAEVQQSITTLASRMKISRKVTVWISEKIVCPLTTGIVKPVILLPVSAITSLSGHQLEAVLIHELNHIKRFDYLFNLCLICCETVLFFNPFARLLSGIVKKERENSCDDKVLELGYHPWEYSQALFTLGSKSLAENRIVLSAAGGGKKMLLQRIKRMLNVSEPTPSLIRPLFAFFLCLLLAVFSGRSSYITKKSFESVDPHAAIPKRDFKSPAVAIVVQKQETIVVTEVTEKTAPKNRIPSSPPKKTLIVEMESPDVTEENFPINVPVFIHDAETVEFTLMDPEIPEVPEVVTSENPPPYIPRSTFYCPIDSLPVSQPQIIRI